jgi:hypothetical protein
MKEPHLPCEEGEVDNDYQKGGVIDLNAGTAFSLGKGTKKGVICVGSKPLYLVG